MFWRNSWIDRRNATDSRLSYYILFQHSVKKSALSLSPSHNINESSFSVDQQRVCNSFSRQFWNWEIVNTDDSDQDNGTKLLNYYLFIGPCQGLKESKDVSESEEQQYGDFAPRQRLGAHCALCEIGIGGKTHYGVRSSTILTRFCTIRFIPVF
ncbi:hypothetical protein TNCV_4659331 [Trichonephila clavipes]|nr:hypothetical protein TNCV_4659331 [Trichonephila clavipes]